MFCLCSGDRIFLDYLIRLTVLSLHHGYTLYISHDYCLYYISFVYLKSFKELSLISKLPFYLIRLTVLSLHHGYTLYISHDYCLYYISFVYLKSFKELSLISKLPFVSESVEVFFEKIFQRSETGTGSPSRSLSTAKVRYKATPEKTGNLTFTLSMLQRVSLSKAGAKLRTFFQTPTFTRLFFDFS